MISSERKVLCTIEKSYASERDEQLGKLRVYFEVHPGGEITPINSSEFFCNTEQVFVTTGYSDLKEKYGNSLFEARCVHTKNEVRDGDCSYVTRADSCEEIRGLQVCQVFKATLPDSTNPTLSIEHEPITKTILISDNNFFYGPFEVCELIKGTEGSCQINIKAITTPLSNSIPPFHIGKVSEHKCIQYYYSRDNSSLQLLANIKKIFESVDEKIDYINDEQIISTYGTKVAQSSEIRSFTKGTVAQIRKHYSTSKEFKVFPKRFERLFNALEMAEGWDNSRTELLEGFINQQKGQEILEQYIESNKERFFQNEKQAFIEYLKTKHKQEQDTIDSLTSQKEKVEAEIRKLVREKSEFEVGDDKLNSISLEERKKIDSELSSQRDELDKLSAEVLTLEEKHNLYKTLEALQKAIIDHQNERDMRLRDKQAMEAQVYEVAQKLKESNDKLTSRLVKLKPDVDALCGLKPKVLAKPLDYHVEVMKQTPSQSNEDIREEFIDNVLDVLNKLGRKTDYYTAANILTTISQCQFTLFSGLPGTGKTSLAKMIGTSLGLNNRLLNIPVARGWTSSRDVLGFYNALSQSFNPSATGLYDLLKHLHHEDKDSAPAIVLLDEFNLSQPEHYFSPFLEMADPESKREIITGDPDEQYLKIPSYLRFLGTINQDESVQGLTPRMLDRSAIINFDDFEQNYDLSINMVNLNEKIHVNPISGKTFTEIFAPTSLDLTSDIEVVLKSIIDKLREDTPEFGMPIIISYRKIKAIRAYHNVASPLMFENRYAALDYAVCQHILPLLNGYGQHFGKRLEEVQIIIPDEMERSQKMLKRIIEKGKQNMFSYGSNI